MYHHRMEPGWARDGETTTKSFTNWGDDEITVTVSITGKKWDNVRSTSEDVEARLTVSLTEGRFDVNKLTIRGALMALLVENKILNANLNAVQKRSAKILQYARDARKKIMSLGGDDPGSLSLLK